MVIVPVKTSDENSPVVAALYGNAEWFALVNGDKVEILANKGKGNGIETAKFLLSTGADATLYVHLGNGPFTALNEGGMKVFYLGKEEMPLSQAMEAYKAGSLPEVTPANSKELLDPGMPSGQCECGCDNG